MGFPWLSEGNRALDGLWRVLRPDEGPEESWGDEMELMGDGFTIEGDEVVTDPFSEHAMSLPWSVAGPADLLRMLNRAAYVTCTLYYKRVRKRTLLFESTRMAGFVQQCPIWRTSW